MPETLSREERQRRLRSMVLNNPFLTDRELAEAFDVSVATIRLDRHSLGIPEVRERIRRLAETNHRDVRSMESQDIVGDLIDIELGSRGISILESTEDMVFERTQIVRSHFILAQADSLALAIIDSPVALTGLANVKYRRPVRVGERLVAKGEVIRRKGENKFVVLVLTEINGEQVFRGKFVVFAIDHDQAEREDSREPLVLHRLRS